MEDREILNRIEQLAIRVDRILAMLDAAEARRVKNMDIDPAMADSIATQNLRRTLKDILCQ